MKKVLSWLDNNIVTVIALFLLVFIPLYPKIPEFDILPGYNVRVRMEDFLILFSLFVFGIQFIRRKIKIAWDLPTIGIIAYLAIGLLSIAASVFIVKSIPIDQHLQIEKALLHWLRRIEYFSMFFLLFSVGKSFKQVKITLGLFFATLIAVTVYGYGQKYFTFCAYSTMNREFAKGPCLLLTDHSRVLSTFGGHYDLAAYLVIALSLGWSIFFSLKNKIIKTILGLALIGGLWLLILTSSRISFASYLVGLSAVIFFWAFKKGIGWAIGRWLIIVSLSVLLVLSFGDLSDRFSRIIRFNDRFSGITDLLRNSSIKPPGGTITISDVTSKSDMPPVPARPGDVTGKEVPLTVPIVQPDGSIKYVEKPRTYSPCALKFDLSTCIRLEATWPRAISAFKKDPFFGTGYATLTRANIEDFTDAESTDNDYLRALGETGLLGFLTFFGVIGAMVYFAIRSLGGLKDPLHYALVVGFISFILGILANASYIDVFESSKVAYVFWGVSGMVSGYLFMMRQKIKDDRQPMKLVFDWKRYLGWIKNFLLSDKPWVLLILAGAIFIRTINLNDPAKSSLSNPIADWHSWRQADTSAVSREFARNGINLLYPTYEDLSSIPSGFPNPAGLRYVEFPIYNAVTVLVQKVFPELSIEAAGRLVTIFSSALSALFIFEIVKKLFGRRPGYLSMIVFSFLPFSIYYGRTILPDPSIIMFSLGAIYFLMKYVTHQKILTLAISAIFAACAFLLKPTAGFVLLPIAYLWAQTFGFNWKKWLPLVIYGAFALAPFVLWRLWIVQFPQGIPASDWLFNGDGIRFKGAFWQWIFADRIGRLILGYWGLVLLGFGLVRRFESKYKMFPLILFLGAVAYVITIATGNVRHDYYQILLLPALTILVGLGLDYLIFNEEVVKFLKNPKNFFKFVKKDLHSLIPAVLGVVSFLFMIAFSYYNIKDYYNINHPEIVEAGLAFQKEVTNGKATVVAPYDGDTAFLYQTGHKGWPIMEGSIDDMIKKGADYYVSTKFDDTTNELLKYSATKEQQAEQISKNKKPWPQTLIVKTDKYVIVQLVPDDKLPKN